MRGLQDDFLVNTFLDPVKPGHMALVFMIVFAFAIIMSFILMFHFNKYRHYSFGTILGEVVYIIGLVLLFFLALIFLVLFSK